MVLNGYMGKEELYEIIKNKLLSLGIIEAKYPLDSFKISKAYSENLQLDLKPFPTLSLGGLLYKDPEDVMSIMCINSSKSKKSQNFDVMHELCHYWLHPAGEHLCYDSNFIMQNKGIEWPANEGAAQALMPEKLFLQMYIYFSGNINRLSDHFIVSKTAVEYRISNLKLFPASKLRVQVYKSKKARHCKICGNENFFFGTSYKWSVYSDGSDIENSCPDCGLLLDQKARYCIRCGSVSTLSIF